MTAMATLAAKALGSPEAGARARRRASLQSALRDRERRAARLRIVIARLQLLLGSTLRKIEETKAALQAGAEVGR